MRVHVDGIPSSGRLVEFSARDAWASSAATVALDGPATTLSGHLTLRPANDNGLVEVTGVVVARASAICDRCGEACERQADADIHLLFAPEAKEDESFDGGEIELEADDLDLGWYTNSSIDLAEVLGEAMALALPSRIACTDQQACDKRTDALLAAAAPASEPVHPALAAIRDRLA
jgi:uncharacterized metal-binding protein YceD (DUF177 family)